MGKYSYLILDMFFLGIPLVYAFKKHGKTIKMNIPFLLFSLLFGVIGFWIVDPVATLSGAWGYDYHKTLGMILPGNGVIEEFLWAILIAIFLGIFVSVFAEREEKGKPFITFLRKR